MEKVKAFFFICAGILMLLVAIRHGVDTARADFDPTADGPIVGVAGVVILTDESEAWTVHPYTDEWIRVPGEDPPVSEMLFFADDVIVSTNGDVWFWRGEWINFGSPPIGTPASASTWSQLKSKFGR